MTPASPARGVAVVAALLFGLACVPELADGATASNPTTTSTPTSSSAGVASRAVAASAARSAAAQDAQDIERLLPRELPGSQVLADHGDLLSSIETRTGLDRARLVRALGDSTVSVDTDGMLVVRDPAARAEAASGDGPAQASPGVRAQAATGSGAPAPALSLRVPGSETFTLQSRPGAARTLYIDANGATVAGTAWNGTEAGDIPDGTWNGFNETNGDPAAFSDYELAWIQEVWRQVSEAYAPFDVNVTTLDPGSAALTRSRQSDTTYGATAVITTSTTPAQSVCGGACLGVGFVNTFGQVDPSGYYSPAWVFASGGMSPTTAAQAVSHEVGHNLGLEHDGRGSADYEAGSALWGPIMGSARNRAVSQWSKGEYTGATNTGQDDLTIIAAKLGLRTDDHGNTPAAATALGSRASYDVEGVIASRDDRDLVRLDLTCPTVLEASASGIGAQTTLDVSLDLLDATGAVLDTDSPAAGYTSSDPASRALRSTGMDASVSASVAPGTYYLRVDGVGAGTAAQVAAREGWTDYASLGQWRLVASGCAQAPTAAPTGEPSPSPTSGPTSSPTGTSPSSGTSPSGDPSGNASTTPTATPAPTPTSPTPTPPTAVPPAPPVPPAAPATVPGAPTLVGVAPGARRGPLTVTVRWSAPGVDGGASVTGYRVTAYQLNGRNKPRRTLLSAQLSGSARSAELQLPRGRYRMAVQALNRVGPGPVSAPSGIVRAR